MDDEMDNMWGCNLVHRMGRFPDKRFCDMELAVTEAVRGFSLHSFEISGTSANKTAIELATDYEVDRCLFAQGSYLGVCALTKRYSTTTMMAAGQLALPTEPHMMLEAKYRNQIVALPYLVPCADFKEDQFLAYERSCLAALNRKLLRAKIDGKPFKAIILELVLCGSGGELRPQFLETFSMTVADYGMVIIVDEIMTAGRTSRYMTLTATAPITFRNQVAYITMGKITNCGMVLVKKAKRPQDDGDSRGRSTNLPAGGAWQAFTRVHQQLEDGMVDKRRRDVLAKMNVGEEHWGRGCLIFTNRSRPHVMKGLKNRLLPLLEDTKIVKGSSKESQWTKYSVCDALMESGMAWIKEMDEGDHSRRPFVYCLAAYMLDTKEQQMSSADIIEHIGKEAAEELAEKEQMLRLVPTHPRSGRCQKRAKSYFDEVLGSAAVNVSQMVRRSRKGTRRKTVYMLNRDQLVEVDGLL